MRDPSANASPSASGAVHARLSIAAAYLAACAMMGIQLPFFPIFLADRGLGPDAIGLAIALPMAIRLVAMPLAGIVSDHLGTPRIVLIGLGFTAAATFALVGLATSAIWLLLAVGLSAIFWSPIFPLLEAYALQLANLGTVDYGRARLWGSASFIAANLAGGFLLDRIPPGAIIWLMVGSILLFALTSRMLPAFALPHKDAPRLPMHWPSSMLILGVVAAACVQASHALLYGFSSLQWKAGGLDASTIGFFWSIGTAAEIGLFYVGTRMLGKISALSMIMIGGVAAALRFGIYAMNPPAMLISVLQMLHAFTFGATHLGLMALIAQNTPSHTAGRAQTFSSAVLGMVMAVATVAAGSLYGRLGVSAYGWFSLLGAAGAAIALAAILQPQRLRSGGETNAPS